MKTLKVLLVSALTIWFFGPVVMNMLAYRRFDGYFLERRFGEIVTGFVRWLGQGSMADPLTPNIFWVAVIVGTVIGAVAIKRWLFKPKGKHEKTLLEQLLGGGGGGKH